MIQPRTLQTSKYRTACVAFVLSLLTVCSRAYSEDNAVPAAGTSVPPSVTQIVAGILQYARWPDTQGVLQLCITGSSQHAADLMQPGYLPPYWNGNIPWLSSNDTSLEKLCHALYLGELPTAEKQALFTRIRHLPILTISEYNPGCTTGSMFCLKIEQDSIGFQVNLDSVARSGVRIHPNVLMLGKPAYAEP